MLLDEDKRIKVVFDVFFNAQDYDEADELNKKLRSLIGDGEFLLPLLDKIDEHDHSKWTVYGYVGCVQTYAGEYFSGCSIELHLNSLVDEETVREVKQRFVDTDTYTYHLVYSLLEKIPLNDCQFTILDVFM
jgi:hypothetical protein